MAEHSLEAELPEVCPRCGRVHDAKFFSLFCDGMHYIVGDCESCGYRIEFERNDLGALFLPDGSVAAISEQFKREQVEHMRERVQRESPESRVIPDFSHIRMRFLK